MLNSGLCPGPTSRRSFLKMGTLGLGGFGLSDLFRLRAAAGVFGRSPRVSTAKGSYGTRYGREHWPQAMSILVSGGGSEHGQVVGSTNDKGEHPHDRPLTPNDLWATVLRHLRIDQHSLITDHTGRPHHLLPFGEPIRELI